MRSLRSIPPRAVLALIAAYQALVRPHLVGCCKFHPTCSDYAAEAVLRHGLRRGSVLAIRRLVRCHPFGPGGIDPVPAVSGPTHQATLKAR